MPRIFLLLIAFSLSIFTAAAFANELKQTIIIPEQTQGEGIPLVVIYTLSSCPHCREAKEYLIRHKIPYINREIDTNDEHLATLMNIYDSMGIPEQKRGVPFFVIGNRINIQGFSVEKLQNALEEVTSKSK